MKVHSGKPCWHTNHFSVCLLGLAFASQSPAMEFSLADGEINGGLDTSLSYGLMWRVQGADKHNDDPNLNDGNRNFSTGLVSEVFKVTSDLELNYGDYGAFVRATAFYDRQIMDRRNDFLDNNPLQPSQSYPDNNRFTADTRDTAGHDATLLDAYVRGSWTLAEIPVSARLGRQVFNWGEGMFYRGGVNASNPVDAGRLRLPGAELKEVLVPIEALNLSFDLADNLSLEGFYQWKWKETAIDPVGTFFAETDILAPGGHRGYNIADLDTAGGLALQGAALGYANLAQAFPGQPAPAQAAILNTGLFSGGINSYLADSRAIQVVERGSDLNARNDGQYGLALRFIAEELNATEFGFYYVNYHAKEPTVYADLGGYGGVDVAQLAGLAGGVINAAGLAAIDLLGNVQARRQYAEDIRMFGSSFSTTLGNTSVFGELSYRPNMPIGIATTNDLVGDLIGQAAGLADTSGLVGNGAALIAGQRFSRGGAVKNSERVEVFNTSLGAIHNFGRALGFDSLVAVGEVASEHLRGSNLQYWANDGSLRYYSGRSDQAYRTGASDGDQVTRDAYGYTLIFDGTWNDVVAGINLSPFVVYKSDIQGNSHQTGNFIEGRKAFTLGMRASYQNNLQAELQYTEFYGAGQNNIARDRDNIGLTLKYAF